MQPKPSPLPEPTAAAEPAADVLDAALTPVAAADVTLTSGRRYELASDQDRDRLIIRGRSGEVVLRVEMTAEGPVLSFSGAAVELAATRKLTLAAEEIALSSTRDLSIDVGGDQHVRVAGASRSEAARVEVQANVGGVAVKAMEKIALDGEHIGLNDDPAPAPFPWSAIAEDGE